MGPACLVRARRLVLRRRPRLLALWHPAYQACQRDLVRQLVQLPLRALRLHHGADPAEADAGGRLRPRDHRNGFDAGAQLRAVAAPLRRSPVRDPRLLLLLPLSGGYRTGPKAPRAALGRASWRERVLQYVELSVVADSSQTNSHLHSI